MKILALKKHNDEKEANQNQDAHMLFILRQNCKINTLEKFNLMSNYVEMDSTPTPLWGALPQTKGTV